MRTVDPVRHEARRRAILEAAAVVFAERGYEGATSVAICRQAGVGSGTLFHYFGDKRSLMVGLFADDLANVDTFLDELDRDDPVDAVWAILDRIARDLADPLAPGLVVAAIQLALRDEEFATMLAAHDDRVRLALADVIGRARDAGLVGASLDPHRAARWVHGLVDAAYLMCGNPPFDVPAETAELRRIVAAYLALPTPQAGASRPRNATSIPLSEK